LIAGFYGVDVASVPSRSQRLSYATVRNDMLLRASSADVHALVSDRRCQGD
jgi:hypothetical protein